MTKFTTFLSAPAVIWTALGLLGASIVILRFVTNSRWRFAAWRTFEVASASLFLSSSVTMTNPDQLGISWGILKGIFYLVLLFGARVGLQKKGDAITPFAASEWRVFIAIGFVGVSVFCSLANDIHTISTYFERGSFTSVSDSNSELQEVEYAPCDNDGKDSVFVMPSGGSLCKTFKMTPLEAELYADCYSLPRRYDSVKNKMKIIIPKGMKFVIMNEDEGHRVVPLDYTK
ncbi:MAG: hypothetical protein WCG55_01895 [bacterium]